MNESMNDFREELEKSYSLMGDGVHNTDELLSWKKAQELLISKEPVTLTITEVNKGGAVVDFENIKGFVPISGISLSRIDNLKPYLFSEITVQAIEVNMEEDKLVFSARELLKNMAKAAELEKTKEISIGSTLTGTVESLKDYGAFIKLDNGLTGLVHISQICDKRIKHPGKILSLGQEVNVKVIDIKDGRISLSIKALSEPAEEELHEEEDYVLPESESIGTSLGDLLKGFNLK